MTQQRCGTSQRGESRMWTNTSWRYKRLHFSPHLAAVHLISHQQTVNKNESFIRLFDFVAVTTYSMLPTSLAPSAGEFMQIKPCTGLILKLFYGLTMLWLCSQLPHTHYPLCSAYGVPLFGSVRGSVLPAKMKYLKRSHGLACLPTMRGLMRNDL